MATDTEVVDPAEVVHPAEVVDPAEVVGAKAVSQRTRGPSSLGVELSPKGTFAALLNFVVTK